MIIWQAWCPLCGVGFEHEHTGDDNPVPHGCFCPSCQDDRRVAPGVLNFHSVPPARPAAEDAP